MSKFRIAVAAVFTSVLIAFSSFALAQDEAPKQTLFTNVHIFDGASEERLAGNVLVEGNLIKQVSAEPINAPGATVIDGGGGTLMPGLIDMHSARSHLYALLGPVIVEPRDGELWAHPSPNATSLVETRLLASRHINPEKVVAGA